MQNIILIFIICIALAMSLYTGIYTLFRCQSTKKNYFMLLQTATIIFLFGHLLELTSSNAGESYTAIKVLYAGACFAAVFAFFFVADYCGIVLHPVFVKAPMTILSLFIILIVWTNKFHHLVYAGYWFSSETTYRLAFTPGMFYLVFRMYPSICLITAMGIVIFQLKKWRNKYRRQLIIFLICMAIPFAAEGIYYLSIIMGINNHNIYFYNSYFTPYSIAAMALCLYISVMYFDIFDIIPAATITAIDYIKEGFILTDAEGNYLSCNPAALKIFPGIAKLTKGRSIFSVGEWPEELKNLDSEKADFSITREAARYYQTSISSVFSQDNILKAKIILIRDVTETTLLMKKLENAAYTDALTGLYNRRYFSVLASMTVERSRRLEKSIYAVMVDLDLFKLVNDTYGHAAGDLVLKTTAGIIRQTVRSYDVVCRYGGEEFVLVLTDTDLNGAWQLLERIRKNIAKSEVKYQEAAIKITCSVGFAIFDDDDSLEKAIRKADLALYTAKNGGRNMVKLFAPAQM